MQIQSLSQLMKNYEIHETGRTFLPYLPIYCRLDGRAFHTFTKGFDKPFDSRLNKLMVETTKFLVQRTHALIGYTQSDEISLVWYNDTGSMIFEGSIFKLTSNIASLATAAFVSNALNWFPEIIKKILPTFDCRVLQLPNKEECTKMFLWRSRDVKKNSISSLANCHFSHKKLQGKNGDEKLAMLKEIGVEWDKYPKTFREGAFVRKYIVEREITQEELEKIPEKHREGVNMVTRSVIEVDDRSFTDEEDKVSFIFGKVSS